ncbi:MAG: tRNA lysidine(34) synthetase TilS [Terrimicrobiaceae bacterium]
MSSQNKIPPPADPLWMSVSSSLADIPKSRKMLVGVSGGRDSMVLLDALLKCGFTNLVVCHLNHTLRGRSASADERFVTREAVRRGLRVEIARSRTADFAKENSLSIELAARELRYAFFQECAKRTRCRILLLAHHADDQVETCLFNFLRGTGAAGLGGMKPIAKRGSMTIRRPMLGVTRAEILDYQKQHGIRFREDASNAEIRHTRNKLRLHIIPSIEEAMGPSFRHAILRAADILRSEDEWMTGLTPQPGEKLSLKALRQMHPAAQARLVLAWLKIHDIPEAGFKETNRVLSLLDISNPAKVNLPGDWHARRRAGVLFLVRSSR